MAYVIGKMLVAHAPYAKGANVLLLESFTDDRKRRFHVVQNPLHENMAKITVPIEHVKIFKINGRKLSERTAP